MDVAIVRSPKELNEGGHMLVAACDVSPTWPGDWLAFRLSGGDLRWAFFNVDREDILTELEIPVDSELESCDLCPIVYWQPPIRTEKGVLISPNVVVTGNIGWISFRLPILDSVAWGDNVSSFHIERYVSAQSRLLSPSDFVNESEIEGFISNSEPVEMPNDLEVVYLDGKQPRRAVTNWGGLFHLIVQEGANIRPHIVGGALTAKFHPRWV
jgi:hypothetical protein